MIIRGGEGSLNTGNLGYFHGDGPDPVKTFQEEVKTRKAERQDFYNAQREQAESLNELLKGTKGSDFKYMQDSIVGVRDEIRDLFQSAGFRGYNTPEFQSKLFELKDKLNSVRNGIDTFSNQVAEAQQYKAGPFVVRGEVDNYIRSQAQLPPNQRDNNLLNTIQNDPKFFNPFAYVSTALGGAKSATALLDRSNKDLYMGVEVSYNPLLYRQEGNQVVFDPDDSLVDQLLSSPQFRTQMMNMLPPEMSERVVQNGDSDVVGGTLREVTMDYLKSVAERQFSPSEKEAYNKAKYVYKPTAADKKEMNDKEEAQALIQNMSVDPIGAVKALSVGEGETGYHGFAPIEDSEGNTIGYSVKFRYKNPNKLKAMKAPFVEAEEEFIINGDPAAALNMLMKAKAYTESKKALDTPIKKSPKQAIVSDGSDVGSWQKTNEYKVGDSIYFFDNNTGKWSKR